MVKVTLAGSGFVETADGRQEVPPGCCLVSTFADHLTYGAGPEGWEFVFMTIAGRTGRCLIEDLVAAHGHVMRVDHEGHTVRELCERAAGSGIRHMQIDAGTAARMAGNLLVHLIECNAERLESENRLLHRVTGLLAADLADPPSVSNVARQCDISREHLTRVFRDRMGIPPGQWLRGQRMRHAHLLLRSTDLPVAEIAGQVGFLSVSAFIASFRAAFGTSPGRLRRDGQ